MTQASDRELALLLAPARSALERLPPEVREPLEAALGSAHSVLELAAAQAAAAELRAVDARRAAESSRARADRIVFALDRAVDAERQRWRELSAVVADHAEPATADALVSALQLAGPVADADAFDRWMGDEAAVLSLRADQHPAAPLDHADRLGLIARPYANPPLDATGTAAFLSRAAAADRLANAVTCGACVRYADGQQAVLLGDGTAIIGSDGRRSRVTAPAGRAWDVAAHRWASGAPPVLLPSARAAVAAAQGAREAGAPGEGQFAADSLLGAAIGIHADRRPTVIDVARAIRAVLASADAGTGAAAWLELAYLTLRVTVYLARELPPAGTATEALIDVGRVRWCELALRPVVWLPLQGDDPDTVGGGDRSWTSDPPAAGATWHARSPALRLDPTWHARIVVDPSSGRLLCVAPDGSWWDLAADIEAITLARRDHIDHWLRALEDLERDLPARIQAARSLSRTVATAPRAGAAKELPEEPERFSRGWIIARAQRYGYTDDTDVRAAGERAARLGRYSREDFLTVVRWKSARALPRAERNRTATIEDRTRAAFDATDELTRITALLELDGVGAPIASALLHFAFPDTYPILDYRALASLGDTATRTQYSPRFWVDYVDRCRWIAQEAGVSIRELDKALWQDSKETDPQSTAGRG